MYDSFRLAHLSGDGVHWQLQRNCSVTPQQLLAMFLSLCAVSLAVSLFFWSRGATLVLPFAVVELLAVGTAFVVYARHAADAERISLGRASLVVETERAGRIDRCEFSRHGVRVATPDARGALVEVRGDGRSVQVGRHLRPELRAVLAKEICLALKV